MKKRKAKKQKSAYMAVLTHTSIHIHDRRVYIVSESMKKACEKSHAYAKRASAQLSVRLIERLGRVI